MSDKQEKCAQIRELSGCGLADALYAYTKCHGFVDLAVEYLKVFNQAVTYKDPSKDPASIIMERAKQRVILQEGIRLEGLRGLAMRTHSDT